MVKDSLTRGMSLCIVAVIAKNKTERDGPLDEVMLSDNHCCYMPVVYCRTIKVVKNNYMVAFTSAVTEYIVGKVG